MLLRFEVNGSVKKIALRDELRAAEALLALGRQFLGCANVRLGFQDQDGEAATITDDFDSSYFFDNVHPLKKTLPIIFVTAASAGPQSDIERLSLQLGRVEEEMQRLRLPTPPEQRPKSAQEQAVHSRIGCDGCSLTPIVGRRFKCLVCYDFDLCEKCEQKGHPHPMVRSVCDRDYLNVQLLQREYTKISRDPQSREGKLPAAGSGLETQQSA